ncbi:MAG: YraN family protein [Clostridia bacterium]|nr:YraN family protein [Clostridia bacterium]
MFFFKKLTPKQKTGRRGEKLAAEFLENKGYRILERNFRSGRNEIDIIASFSGDLIFVEVKSTASDKAEEIKFPSEAVDAKKKGHIIDCAIDYIQLKKRKFYGYRFDVIEVYLNRDEPEINHIENAFYINERTKRQWNR